ncbi:hypothetical protein [Halorubrum pallidum]|uniref:Uncharacterized protein n=1 Tax=Halorubrum pallidum TaxID=1526114 RepID=A0ABD5T504_9EURY
MPGINTLSVRTGTTTTYQREERLELVEAAVRKEVDRRKSEVDNGNGGGF